MSRKLRKSFVGHRDTILFWLISREGVFQQPQAFALTTWVVGVMAIMRWSAVERANPSNDWVGKKPDGGSSQCRASCRLSRSELTWARPLFTSSHWETVR